MYGNRFNYAFLAASMVATLGLSYCLARFIVGRKPSLAAASTVGTLAGVFIFGVGYVVASHAHGLPAMLILLASFVFTSLFVCCALILRRARQYHSARRFVVSTITFSVIAVPALGMWVGMTLTVFFGDPIP